jgi:deoxyribodipyrimidine photolyase-related protein
MSNCAGRRFDPAQSTRAKACLFTTPYWDFLLHHQTALTKNPRSVMQVRNLKRLTPRARDSVRKQAK